MGHNLIRMAPMLAVTFKLAATDLGYGMFLILLYGVGHCTLIVLTGTFTKIVQRYLNWNERSHGAALVKRVCDGLILLAGLYMLYIA